MAGDTEGEQGMSIRFACASCGKQFVAKPELAGKRGKCNQCGGPIQIPAITAGDPSNPEVTPAAKVHRTTSPSASMARKRSSSTAPVPRQAERTTPPQSAQRILCPSCGTLQLPTEAACTACGSVLASPAEASSGPQPWFKRPPIIIPAATVAAVLFFVIVYFVMQAIVNPSRNAHQIASEKTGSATPDTTTPDATGERPAPSVAASTPGIQYSPRPAPRRIAFFDMYKMRISGSGPGYPVQLFVYIPAEQHAAHALPCVLIAPAGSRLFHGMSLAEGDIREHLPYVQAGFAVCAYELAGPVATMSDRVAYRDLELPAREFALAEGGVANAQAAINYIVSQFPEIDATHLYAAGHSSAANVALDVALTDHRIKGVAAYAPATDVESRLASTLSILNKLVPGEAEFIARISPIRRVNDFACPVLLFHADDDTNVPTADNQNFADAMTRAGKTIRFIRVPAGGHYQSMIDQGINAGIEFFKSLGAQPFPSTIQPPAPPSLGAPH